MRRRFFPAHACGGERRRPHREVGFLIDVQIDAVRGFGGRRLFEHHGSARSQLLNQPCDR